MKNYYTRLARLALAEYLNSGKKIDVPDDYPKELKERRAGCFVSYHKGEELRGCIGTFLPAKSCLAEEIISNSIAASRDPRFLPLTKDELRVLSIKIDILSPPEKTKIENLNPKKYGVIIKTKNCRAGLLLPNLKGVDSAEKQIEICRQKAGINPEEKIEIYRFEAERYEE